MSDNTSWTSTRGTETITRIRVNVRPCMESYHFVVPTPYLKFTDDALNYIIVDRVSNAKQTVCKSSGQSTKKKAQ
jgi:hypothetical protein